MSTIKTITAPQNDNAYRTMLRQADELETTLRNMSGDEANFFQLQNELQTMETAMCQYSLKVNGYYNHRFNA